MSDQIVPGVDAPCPIGRAAETIGDRWMLLILRHATAGVTRFDDFRQQLGIADNILSNRLGRLVQSGLLVKAAYRDERRTRHEYRLTTAGADLLPVLHALAAWGQQHPGPTRGGSSIRSAARTCRSASSARTVTGWPPGTRSGGCGPGDPVPPNRWPSRSPDPGVTLSGMRRAARAGTPPPCGAGDRSGRARSWWCGRFPRPRWPTPG